MIRKRIPEPAVLAHWYERYLSPVALIAGFVADTLLFAQRVDLWQTNALFAGYLIVAALGIAVVNMVETGRVTHPRVVAAAPIMLVVVQFSFGNLFSGFLSLYSRNAALAVNWIFVFALATLLVGNERFTRLYRRFPFQVGIYFAVLFSYLVFFLPIVFKKIGVLMFITSGLASLAIIAVLLLAFLLLAPGVRYGDRLRAIHAIVGVFIAINVLYFTGITPPLPLALKEAGVYHHIERVDGAYILRGEAVAWYEEYLSYETTFRQASPGPVYVWSTVFAPTGLSTMIEHEWQRFDEQAGEWRTTDTLLFPISGGRDGGYRGYSYKSDVSPGTWRVNVLTGYGQLIARISFRVVAVDTSPPLTEMYR
ncbi:DUF2914 domain-containing protein [Candidatus Kaiserbacteria bacterium]|nr:DUF2914 domain-containing protein [Candidatus Kaiserbacteria bacterium]